MRRWLAIGAVVGFGVAVLAISVFGGPGDKPAPATAIAVDAGIVVVPARPPEAAQVPLEIPSAAQRKLGAMGTPIAVDQPGKPLPGHEPPDGGAPQ
jgi:hypothetical protein